MNVAELEDSVAVLESPESMPAPAGIRPELEQETTEFICRQVLERGATFFDG
jgi:hypothetical protein